MEQGAVAPSTSSMHSDASYMFGTEEMSYWKTPRMRSLDEKLGDLQGELSDLLYLCVEKLGRRYLCCRCEIQRGLYEYCQGFSEALKQSCRFIAEVDVALGLASAGLCVC